MIMNRHQIDGLCVEVEAMEVGVLATNVYFVDDGDGGTIVVDPADDCAGLLETLGERRVSAIFVTHGHYDHVGALEDMRKATGAPAYAMADEVERIEHPHAGYAGRMAPPSSVDVELHDGDVIEVGKTRWQVLHTPGHTMGCCCYICYPADGTREGKPTMLCGDMLFYGSIGRTDLEGSDWEAMRGSLAKLAKLDDEIVALPGHGSLTSIGLERGRTIDRFRFSGEKR